MTPKTVFLKHFAVAPIFEEFTLVSLPDSGLRVDVQEGAECWLRSPVSEWGGWCSVLNGALIRLIHGALVYKQAPHNRHSLIARCPRRVVSSMSVLFLKAGKQRCREGRRGKQPQGSCESASEHSTSRRSAKILFQLSHWYLCHRKQQHCGEYSQTPWPKIYSFPPYQQEVHWLWKWKTWINQDRTHEWTEHTPPEPRALQF